MKETRNIILRLIRIKEAVRLSEQKGMNPDDVQVLRDFILENRRQIPSFALAHFDRLEASGKSGISKVEDGKCSSCKSDISEAEKEYLKEGSIGVCNNCYSFLYEHSEDFEIRDFFDKFLEDARKSR